MMGGTRWGTRTRTRTRSNHRTGTQEHRNTGPQGKGNKWDISTTRMCMSNKFTKHAYHIPSHSSITYHISYRMQHDIQLLMHNPRSDMELPHDIETPSPNYDGTGNETGTERTKCHPNTRHDTNTSLPSAMVSILTTGTRTNIRAITSHTETY